MNTKLTLTIEQSVIEKAKKYAKTRERSLSAIIENYLQTITLESAIENEDEELSPIVTSLKGSFKAPENFDYKKELTKELSKKYM